MSIGYGRLTIRYIPPTCLISRYQAIIQMDEFTRKTLQWWKKLMLPQKRCRSRLVC